MFNIFEFIDSKDIREYHEKKHTRFSCDKMAVLVNESRFKNIHNKMKALEELIPYLSDDYDMSTISTSVQYLDHSFKKTVANTIDLYKKLLNCLNIAGIYTIKIYDNGTSYEYDNIFTEYKHAIGFLTKCFAEINITNPDYVYAYVFRRPSKYMNFDRITAYYMVDANLNIFDVSMQGVYYPTLNDYSVWIDLPFKSGDIVENIYGKEKYIYNTWEPHTFNGMLLYNKDMNLQLYNEKDSDTEIIDDEVNPLALKLKEDNSMAIIESIMKEFTKNNEIIIESTVLLDSKSGAQIIVRPDSGRNFGTESYFKFIPDKSVDIKHSARISFLEPKYIYHYKNQYRLSKNDKRALMRMLTSPATRDNSISGWVAIIKEFNRFIENSDKNTDKSNILPENLPMPNYTKL